MNEEEKKAAVEVDAAALAVAEAEASKSIDERDAKIKKLEEERDNYKNVALKRLGKLPNDAEFLDDNAGTESGLSVQEIVKNTLLEREIALEKAEKELEIKRLARENAELKLALKNRPDSGMGSGGGESADVKDNTFSSQQLAALTARAKVLKIDPQKYIEKAKQNLNRNR